MSWLSQGEGGAWHSHAADDRASSRPHSHHTKLPILMHLFLCGPVERVMHTRARLYGGSDPTSGLSCSKRKSYGQRAKSK